MRLTWLVPSALSMCLACSALAEITENHACVAFDNIAHAQKKAQGQEYIEINGVIKEYKGDGVAIVEDPTGEVKVQIPLEFIAGHTPSKGRVVYILGRVSCPAFEQILVDVERIEFDKPKAEQTPAASEAAKPVNSK